MSADNSPTVFVLAGANGAGKTTASRSLLAETLAVMTFVNADEQDQKVPMARLRDKALSIAADLAARAHFDLDSIDDLRMAVDEAWAMLARIAAPDAAHGATLWCRFTVWSERIEVAPRSTPTTWRICFIGSPVPLTRMDHAHLS